MDVRTDHSKGRERGGILLPLLILLLAGCSEGPGSPSGNGIVPAGGATTVTSSNSHAFSIPAPNLGGENLQLHLEGDVAFESEFVAAPAEIHGGLGPIFNNNACISCHVRDGRGRPPGPGERSDQLLLRISRPGSDAGTGGPSGVPGYGQQFLDRSLFGVSSHGDYRIDWSEEAGEYADGTPFSLRRPEVIITSTYREFGPDILISPRVAPPVFGNGLMEAIDESTILEYEDPGDGDGDGISGRANYVWNDETGRTELGRFGWKANTPTLRQQTAAAFLNDMGVTSPYYRVESSTGTDLDDGLEDDPEISEGMLLATVRYVQTLGVPARRNVGDTEVRHGERIFGEIGCAGCHRPSMTTGVLEGVPEVSNQRIAPYTDMLLHDMGEGLADNRPDFLADGREWRTPPLWGIGLTAIVNGHTNFLHDGRARSIAEAILWHGGEGETARERFRTLSTADRAALLRFVESL